MNVFGEQLEGAECPICPGKAKIWPAAALAAHLAQHESKKTRRGRWAPKRRKGNRHGSRARSGLEEKQANVRIFPGARK